MLGKWLDADWLRAPIAVLFPPAPIGDGGVTKDVQMRLCGVVLCVVPACHSCPDLTSPPMHFRMAHQSEPSLEGRSVELRVSDPSSNQAVASFDPRSGIPRFPPGRFSVVAVVDGRSLAPITICSPGTQTGCTAEHIPEENVPIVTLGATEGGPFTVMATRSGCR
jgi:hypothetical protein